MTNLRFQFTIWALLAASWFATAGMCAEVTRDPAVRPNVLLIMVDDLRPALGCYGDSRAITPNIDRLAETSRIFLRAYCQQAVCGPSRTSILTGLLPDHTHVWHNRNRFRENVPEAITLPQLFKQSGYHSQGLGKVFSGNERELDPRSWSVPEVLRVSGSKNYVLPENSGKGKQAPTEFADVPDEAYPDGKLAELAVESLKHYQRSDQPFFLAVGFFKPHLPFNAPRTYRDLHSLDRFRQPTYQRAQDTPTVAYPDHHELAGYRDMPQDERVTAEQAAELRRAYYACVSYTDAQIGKILTTLEATGLANNTIVVLLGDHGFSLGEADHWCKATNFELDTHVPLLIRIPHLRHAGATEALVECVDLYPTLAELAGLKTPDRLDGRTLTPILADPAALGRNTALSQFARPFKRTDPEVMGYSIRTVDHRYTRWIDWQSRETLAEELYAYQQPESVTSAGTQQIEQRNLAPVKPQLLATMRSSLDRELTARLRNLPEPTPRPRPVTGH